MPSTFPDNIYRRILRRMLGKTPYRRLSQTLILALLVISPISFSTEKIPNFAYECPVETGCKVTSRRTVAVHQVAHAIVARPPFHTPMRHNLPEAITPCLELICFNSPSRSPPA